MAYWSGTGPVGTVCEQCSFYGYDTQYPNSCHRYFLLTTQHGAPLRLVIPEMYGYKGVKWLERIEVVAQQPTGFWENLGYDQDAWVGRSNGYG